MPKRDHMDFQDRSTAVGYLLTFRCYGTWLHGDERGSTDRRFHNRFGSPKIAPDADKVSTRSRMLKSPAFILGPRERIVVEEAIKETCGIREYSMYALNARSNHVHVVTGNSGEPERMMNAFKANATRALRSARLLGDNEKAWSRHGSTKYLWTDAEITNAIDYVLYSQGEELVGDR
jgi:REP element-mobilizing transposase RayT